MPLKETLNFGREFLDQFGLEDEGWRTLHGQEIFNDAKLEELPRQLLIPDVSVDVISDYSKSLSPAKPYRFIGAHTILLPLVDQINPTNQAYTWFKASEDNPLGLAHHTSHINTLHEWAYYGAFKPTMAEVISKLSNDPTYEKASSKEFYWTQPVGDGDPRQAPWPNIPIEIKEEGKRYFLESGAYHLGRTALYELWPNDEFSRDILKDYQEDLQERRVAEASQAGAVS